MEARIIGYTVVNGGKKNYKYRAKVRTQEDIERIRQELYYIHREEKFLADEHEKQEIANGVSKPFQFRIFMRIRKPPNSKLCA